MKFIDEAGLNLWLRRRRGRAPVGERAVIVVTGQRGANLATTFAVSFCHGIMHHNLQQASMKAVLFNEFIEQLIQIMPNDGEARTILFDNTRAHLQAEQMVLPKNNFIKGEFHHILRSITL